MKCPICGKFCDKSYDEDGICWVCYVRREDNTVAELDYWMSRD
jgi:hypothetical protein